MTVGNQALKFPASEHGGKVGNCGLSSVNSALDHILGARLHICRVCGSVDQGNPQQHPQRVLALTKEHLQHSPKPPTSTNICRASPTAHLLCSGRASVILSRRNTFTFLVNSNSRKIVNMLSPRHILKVETSDIVTADGNCGLRPEVTLEC